MRTVQVKMVGMLLLTEALMMHQRITYAQIWHASHLKSAIEAIMVAILITESLLNWVRLNHFIPAWLKGDYRAIATRVLSKNAQLLEIEDSQQDIVYTNSFKNEGVYNDEEASLTDKGMGLIDISIQIVVCVVSVCQIFLKEGLMMDHLGKDTFYWETVR
jgi:hypothetical protein